MGTCLWDISHRFVLRFILTCWFRKCTSLTKHHFKVWVVKQDATLLNNVKQQMIWIYSWLFACLDSVLIKNIAEIWQCVSLHQLLWLIYQYVSSHSHSTQQPCSLVGNLSLQVNVRHELHVKLQLQWWYSAVVHLGQIHECKCQSVLICIHNLLVKIKANMLPHPQRQPTGERMWAET